MKYGYTMFHISHKTKVNIIMKSFLYVFNVYSSGCEQRFFYVTFGYNAVGKLLW